MPGTSSSGGRNKKSTREHALAGTGRKDRGTTAPAADAPDPPKGRPVRPKGLGGYALVEWTRMVDRLERAGTLSTVDDAVLYQYCCLFAETEGILASRRKNVTLVTRLQAALAQLRGEDLVEAIAQIVKLKQLETKHTQQLRQGHMALRQYLVELGMTPAARSRVKVTAAPPVVDPFAEFDEPTHAH